MGCAEPRPQAATEALSGGAEDGSAYATALVHAGGTACTGTMIAPDWVLTAAHCVANYDPPPDPETSRLIFGWDAEGGPSNAQRASHLRANACYAHPLAAALAGDPSPVPIERCSETGSGALIDDEVDVALVHLAIPRTDLAFRPIGPVRGPLREGSRTFPARVRGFSTLAGAYTGPVATGSATLRATPVLGARPFDLVLTPARVNAGDSGGPLTYGPSDDVGAVIGVAGSMDTVTSGTTATYASLLEPVTRDWIWSTLDPTGSCALGAAGPCVFRERTPDSGDVCSDSHCTGAETPATCPADCPTSWPDTDGDGLPDIRDLCPRLDARALAADPLVPPVTVASSAAFAGTGRQTSADGSYDTPTGIRTSFRWCPCPEGGSDDITARRTCRGTSQCEIGFERLDDPPDGTWGWRVPSVQYPGAGSSGLDPSALASPYGACVGRDITLRPAQCIATYNPEAPLPRDVLEWVDHLRGSRPLSFARGRNREAVPNRRLRGRHAAVALRSRETAHGCRVSGRHSRRGARGGPRRDARHESARGDRARPRRRRRRGRAHERVRILRLDLESGRSRVIASAHSFCAFTNHYLAQAPGGSFVLAVSRRGRGAGYRLVHFTLPVEPGPVTVIGSYVAHGRNLEGPIVAEGMGVSVAETGSPWRPIGIRWLDFRERRDRGSDFDDCF